MTSAEDRLTQQRSSLLRAGIRIAASFVVALIACAAVYWLLLRDAHQALMLSMVAEIFYGFDPDLGLVLVHAGEQQPIPGYGVARHHSVSVTREALDVYFVGGVFLPALVLATPIAWPRRLRALAVALAVLLVAQLLQLTMGSHAAYLTMTGEATSWEAFVQTVCNFAGLWLSLPIWYLVAGRHWLRGALLAARTDAATAAATKPTIAATTTARNATCPCGSGRKFKKCCGPAATRP